MPIYRIFRMKDSPRQQFRWAPHVSGSATARPKDFEQRGQVEAQNEYDAWRRLRESKERMTTQELVFSKHLLANSTVTFSERQVRRIWQKRG